MSYSKNSILLRYNFSLLFLIFGFLNGFAQTPSATTSTVTVSPAVIPVNGTSTITVQLKEASGNNITSGGATVSFVTPSSGSIGTVTDNGNGTYTAIYTASTMTGSVLITPRLGSTNFVNTAAVAIGTSYILEGEFGKNNIQHSFSTNGNITLNQNFLVDYLIVAGGGGGASGGGGGGGAGGVRQATNTALTAQNYAVTVGNGGAGGAAGGNNKGTNGGNSSAFSVTATGGGAGANATGSPNSGGSGGGAARSPGATSGANATFGEGNKGGDVTSATNRSSAGGGGASSVGGNGGNVATAGAGGAGISSTITGSLVTYAGGGGGSGWTNQGFTTGGSGGVGGGGAGSSTGVGTSGTANTGGGGGAGVVNSSSFSGGSGGSGVVIVRYKGEALESIGGDITSFTGNGTIGNNGKLYQVHTFNSSGSFDLSGVGSILQSSITNSITGTGNLSYGGWGRLILEANNSYIGNTSITGGILQIGDGGTSGTLGSGSISVSSGATLSFNRSNLYTLAGGNQISGSGTVIQEGNGTLNLGGINNHSAGTWILSNGEISNGSISGNFNLEKGAVSAVLAGSGNLTKSTGGVVTLYGNNTYSGTTTINEGTLIVNGNKTGAGAVMVNNGADLKGTGSISGTTTINSGATIEAGNTIGTLSLQNLTIQGGGNLNWQINNATGTAGINWDQLNVSGTLNIGATSSNKIKINVWSLLENGDNGQLANFNPTESFYTWTIISANSITGFAADKFEIVIDPSNGTGGLISPYKMDGFKVEQQGNNIVLQYELPATQTLDGTNNNTETSNYTTQNSTGTLTLNLGFFADYLIVAGGGGGASGGGAGGGAGGLFQSAFPKQLLNQDYPIVVGAGGNGGVGGNAKGTNGANSSAFGLIVIGGGTGANPLGIPNSGGSGGGAARASSTTGGGSGMSGQGFNGGGKGSSSSNISSGGGGGAGAEGGAGGGTTAGSGGNGVSSLITGTATSYAGGGGGSGWTNAGFTTAGSGGNGGGGNGSSNGTGSAGAANTGGGGGAGVHNGTSFNGGNGGSGVVIVRYEGAALSDVGGTVTSFIGDGTNGKNGVPYQVHTFTNNGNFDLTQVDFNARLKATLSGNIVGNGNLVYDSEGRLTLTGNAHTYTGATTVQKGELVINSNISSSASVTVEGTGKLSGTGTLPTTIVNGTHNPGNSPGLQTISGNLTYNTNAVINWELATNSVGTRGTDFDAINVTGNLNFAGATTLNLIFDGSGSAVDWSDNFWDNPALGTNGWKIFEVSGLISNLNNLSINVVNWVDGQNQTYSSQQGVAIPSFKLVKSGNGVYLTYEPLLPSLNNSTVTASPNGIVTNGTSTLTVQLKDQNGNNFPNSGGTITFSTTLGSIGTVTNNNNGTYTATFTAGSTAGTATVTASLDGQALSNTTEITIVTPLLSGNQVIDGTSGNTQVTDVFTTNGNLTLSQGFIVDYLIVGGGGEGGNGITTAGWENGGGGGAGGLMQGTMSLSNQNYGFTVGAGGTTGAGVAPANGANSTAFGLTANGGGRGGMRDHTRGNGGSGGGGPAVGATRSGGTGASGQGNNGGEGSTLTGGSGGAGGGGGAGAAGQNGSTSVGGAGGVGVYIPWAHDAGLGQNGFFAGGGGGSGGTAGNGGNGGGGNASNSGNGSAALANTGGGGGGAFSGVNSSGGAGGSGIVALRYKGATVNPGIVATVSPISIANNTFQVYPFTTTGTGNSFNLTNATPGATLQNTISGSGNLTYNGPGRLVFEVNNNYVGTTTISSGVLQIGAGGNTGSFGSGAITNNATLVFNRSNTYTLSSGNVLSGSGTVEQEGSGALDLGGITNHTAGTWLLRNGSITNGTMSGNFTLESGTVSAILGGSGNLVKSSGATVTLSGNNSYAGTTSINAGILVVNGTHSGTGAITVANGALLKGDGSLAGTTTVNSGATIMGGEAIGTLGFQNLTLAGGANLNWQIDNATGTAGANWGQLNVNGTLSINATSSNKFKINIWSLLADGNNGKLVNFNPTESFYTWTIITATNISGFDANKFEINTHPSNGTGGLISPYQVNGFKVIQQGNNIVIQYDPPAAQTIDGTNNGSEISNYTTSNTLGSLTLDLGFFADYLIVGGGGEGGNGTTLTGWENGGGGGAGGFIQGFTRLTETNYSFVVGAGGSTGFGGASAPGQGSANGASSTAFGLTAFGGGRGGMRDHAVLSGASGGGAASMMGSGANGISGQGNRGGSGFRQSGGAGGAGGGGGAAGIGQNGNGSIGGAGGVGIYVDWAQAAGIGDNGYFAGGGGGSGATAGSGGLGGGGNASNSGNGSAGLANTGGGGGGAFSGVNATGGAGASGVVAIRYEGAALSNIGGTVSTFIGNGTNGLNGIPYQVHTFTSNGNFNLSNVDFNARLKATLSGNIIGNGNLIYDSKGRLTLTGNAHTYTGATTIQNGELVVNSNITSSSSLTVSSTGTLSGTGTLPATEITGTHSPGSSAGIQTVSGNLTYKAGSTINWELFTNNVGIRGTDFDGIDVTGNLDFAGVTTLNLIFNSTGSNVDWSNNFWEGTYTDTNGWLLFDVIGTTSNISNITIVVGNDNDNTGLSTKQPDANGFSLKIVNNKVYLEYTNGSRWTGATDTDWHTSSNWLPNVVPDAGMNAYIANATNQPTTTANIEVKGLTLDAGTTLTIGATHVLKANGNITNNGQIIFKSDATGSGMFDAFTGTISGTGTVQVERYIPARRAFRFLSPSVTTTSSIYANWQENGGNTAGLGTHITGAGGASNGFDTTATNNPSMFGFDHATGQWTAVTSTNGVGDVLTAGTPYRLMVRGDRNTDLTTNTPTATATTLRATGALHTGDYTPTLNQAAEGYSFIGNPYQAPLDMEAVLTNSATNMNTDVLYYWDPTLNVRGAYVTRTLSANSNNINSNFTEILQPGQAVFVKSSAANPTMTITESHKRVSQGTAGVFRNATTTTNVGLLRANLQANINNQWQTTDAALALFNDSYSWDVTQEDASKMNNLDEEVSFVQNNTSLAIAKQNDASETDELPIRLKQLRHTNYRWVFDLNNYNGYTPYLFDKEQNTLSVIEDGTVLPFTAGSNTSNRFKIVFQNTTLNTPTFDNQISLYPNPSNGANGFYMTNITASAKVTLFNLLGQSVPVSTSLNGTTLQVKPMYEIAKGIYVVQVISEDGATKQVKWIVE